MFIILSSLSVIFPLNRDIAVVTPKNHITDALVNPITNGNFSPAVSVALAAPSSIVPSMSACGFIHVTVNAIAAVFSSDMPVSASPARPS